MARTKRTDRKQPPQKQPRQTASLPASSPSRRTRSNCNSAAARTVERAIHEDSFHSDPGRDEIKYSDDESEYSNNTDDTDTDDDKEDSDNDDEEYEDTDNEEEKFDDDRDNKEENENDYSELLDSSLLEDEEPSVSYRVDWVKGKGAGRKPNKGRPPKPNTSNMTSVEAEDAIKAWEKGWKRERDIQRRRNVRGEQVDGCSFVDNSIGYTGCTDDRLRPMTEVAEFALLEGHTFPDKETVLMRIGEEANLYGVRIKIVRSDSFQVDVRGANGDPFHVLAYYGTMALKWKVTKCSTRNGRKVYTPAPKTTKGNWKKPPKPSLPSVEVTDLPPPHPDEPIVDAFDPLGPIEEGTADEPLGGPDEHIEENEVSLTPSKRKRLKSPIKSKWIVPLLQAAITETPNLSGKEIVLILQPYIIDIFLTYPLITKVRNIIRDRVFGDPDTNVTYLPALVEQLEEGGHDFEVVVKSPSELRKRLLDVVLQEKMRSMKKEDKLMLRDQKLKYLEAWEFVNKDMLDDVGLSKDCASSSDVRFVSGVFLSIHTASKSVPLLQTVYQADAAHMNFGKYTLYSCYGITANCNAFPVAFGIVFGNEDKEGWERFWLFVKSRHPCLNDPKVTIITDQQKGSIEAMRQVLPNAVNFFCSYHRTKNIKEQVKGGVGEYSCHWYYNLLLGCGRIETINKHKYDLATKMENKALAYIGLVPDHQQFPAARIAHGASNGVDVYMYQRSSSSTAESMNAANKAVRDRTAVDPVNAMILMLKLESKRFGSNRDKAWSWKEVLTPHGKTLMEKVFRSVNPRDYSITVEAEASSGAYKCYVSRNVSQYNYVCWFPAYYDDEGSLFGRCSCGVPNTDGLPCHHMVAVVKSYKIEGLNETNVMPIWWHTSHWRKQYPRECEYVCNFDMESLRNSTTAKVEKAYVLCPPYAGPRKGGRPREEKRIKGGVELAMEKKMKAAKKQAGKRKGKPVEPEIELHCKKMKKTVQSGKSGKSDKRAGDDAKKVNIGQVGKAGDDSDDNSDILVTEIGKKKAATSMKGTKKKGKASSTGRKKEPTKGNLNAMKSGNDGVSARKKVGNKK